MSADWFNGLSLANSAPVMPTAYDLYSTDFETDPTGEGWTLSSGWEWGAPGGGLDPSSTPDGSTSVIGTVLGGEYSSNLASAYATLDGVGLDSSAYYTLSFDRWLSIEETFDVAFIEVQASGGSWEEVWNSEEASDPTGIGFNGTGAAWVRQTIDLSPYISAGDTTVSIRWGLFSDDSTQYGGWSLDNVVLQSSDQPITNHTLGVADNVTVAAPPETLVSTLVSTATDANGDSLGIAITDLPTPVGSGSWSYSLDGGSSWIIIDETQISETNALLLPGDARLRFESTGSASGYTMTMTYRAWDQSTGSAGSFADTTSNGGTTAFSTAMETADLIVLAPNTAPSLGETSYTDSVDQYAEILIYAGELDFASEQQGEDFSDSIVNDPDGPFDAGGGFAIVDTSGSGLWEYTTDGGTTWHTLSVSATSALLLTSDTSNRLRYTPEDPSDHTETPSLTYKAWDGGDGRANGDTNVDTTAATNNNAYSANTATYIVSITDQPDWIGGTANFDAALAVSQWDTSALPESADTAHFHSNSGHVLTFDSSDDNLNLSGFRLHGDATLVLADGTLSLASDLDADSGTTLRIEGGSLIQEPRDFGANFNISGAMTFSSGTLQSGSGYTTLVYSGSTPLAFHDGTSGTPDVQGMSIEIASGSSAEFLNTTLTADDAQNASSAWFSGTLYVNGTLSVLDGTNKVGEGEPNFTLKVGDDHSNQRSGLVEIFAESGTATVLLTNAVDNTGTIRFVGDSATDRADMGSITNLSSSILYNRGGLIEVTGTAGTTIRLDMDAEHTDNDDGSLTGMITVAAGTTLEYAANNTMTVTDNAGFDIDGTLDNLGTISIEADTEVAGTAP